MKKIIVILILSLLFACGIFVKPQNFSLKNYFNTGLLHTYTLRPLNETSIKLSNIYISTNTKGITKGETVGESLYFENLEVGSALSKLKAKVKFSEYLKEQNLTLIYAYSSLISKYEMVKNIKINLQISTCENYTVIGWPLIYGSF